MSLKTSVSEWSKDDAHGAWAMGAKEKAMRLGKLQKMEEWGSKACLIIACILES